MEEIFNKKVKLMTLWRKGKDQAYRDKKESLPDPKESIFCHALIILRNSIHLILKDAIVLVETVNV